MVLFRFVLLVERMLNDRLWLLWLLRCRRWMFGIFFSLVKIFFLMFYCGCMCFFGVIFGRYWLMIGNLFVRLLMRVVISDVFLCFRSSVIVVLVIDRLFFGEELLRMKIFCILLIFLILL